MKASNIAPQASSMAIDGHMLKNVASQTAPGFEIEYIIFHDDRLSTTWLKYSSFFHSGSLGIIKDRGLSAAEKTRFPRVYQ
jgi:hypothetical protein